MYNVLTAHISFHYMKLNDGESTKNPFTGQNSLSQILQKVHFLGVVAIASDDSNFLSRNK